MSEVNYIAVVVSAVAPMVLSSVWYMMFGKEMAKLHSAYAQAKQPPAWKLLIEFARTFVVAIVLAHLFVQLGINNWTGTVKHALWLWLGFPAVLLTGAVIWESVPPKLAAIHAGDWFVKLVLIAAIWGLWQ